MTNRRNINALMGDRNPRFHMFMNLKQNKEKIDLILKSKFVSPYPCIHGPITYLITRVSNVFLD